ncbi:hypothetical protein LCGC14_0780170 [marine sediment metagenome]|uniref:DNA methylase adenine-specific domain-containing protein n=1 Tax=marine sediment metagenome TaxID=412755 RepID=A0A0F9QFP2_9ZZZZ
MRTFQIPNSIENIYTFFNGVKNCPVKKMNPVPISALSDNLFFNKEHIKNQMTFLWEVVETELYFIWIIQSNKWDRKTWRNNFINKLQSNLVTSILIFVPSEIDANHILEQFSMSVITMDGTLDFPLVVPETPEESVLKIWEAIKSETLNDILEFESQILCEKYKITAESLYDALRTNDVENIIDTFRRAGHKIQDGYVLPKKDTILENAILHITDLKTNPKQVMRDYYNLEGNDYGEEAQWIISLTPDSLTYYKKIHKIIEILFESPKSKESTKKNKELRKKNLKYLTSLVALVSRRATYNAETFAFQYGEFSLLYFNTVQSLKKLFEERKEDKLKVIFQEWQRRFETVYRKGDVNEDLFLKHTYLGLLIRLVLYVVYFPKQKLKTQSIIEMTTWLEERGFSLFTYDFFSWSLDDLEILELLYSGLKPLNNHNETNIGRIFEADDLFRTIYQQMVSPTTRHALGEFYTPPELARIMVEEKYKFGQKVLDPACGSGTFIVEIIRKIKSNAQKSMKEKLKSLKNVYGFDVNPIAVATSKANVLMHLKDLIEENEDLNTNIFLCNSLFPVELIKFKDMQFGQTLEFKLPTINESIVINTNFFSNKYQRSFGHVLSILDALMTKEYTDKGEFEKQIKNVLERDEFIWMNEKIFLENTLKDNFIFIAKKFYNLTINNKDHIWIYLLYQSLGSFLVSKKVDLIIGNPPWLTLKAIYSKEYKEQIKELASELDIKPTSQNITNLEMSAVFLYQALRIYLKEEGIISFVLSKAFIGGSQHDGTRRFHNLNSICIWDIDKDIFKIPCIVFFGQKSLNPTDSRFNIKVTQIKSLKKKVKKKYLFTKSKVENYKPLSIDIIKGKQFVKKLVPESLETIKLPKKENSYYKIKAGQGASIGPQNLLFVEIIKEEGDFTLIKPAKPSRPQKPWTFLAYDKTKIESEYIIDLAKSTGLVPFVVTTIYKVFLPIDCNTFDYDESKIKVKAKKHFSFLNDSFKEHQKKGASITDLWKSINHHNKLTADRQKNQLKVVSNASGKFVKAALLRGNVVIEHKLYLCPVDNEEEGYYLCALLNSPPVSEDVMLRAATGFGGKPAHFEKRPYDIDYPKYNRSNPIHKKISNFGKKMEERANQIIEENRNDSRVTLQRKILEDLKEEYNQLANLVLKMFKIG